MDAGTTAALTAVIGGLLAAFGAGDLVPFIGPAVNGAIAVIALGSAIISFLSHRTKTSAMVAAGIL